MPSGSMAPASAWSSGAWGACHPTSPRRSVLPLLLLSATHARPALRCCLACRREAAALPSVSCSLSARCGSPLGGARACSILRCVTVRACVSQPLLLGCFFLPPPNRPVPPPSRPRAVHVRVAVANRRQPDGTVRRRHRVPFRGRALRTQGCCYFERGLVTRGGGIPPPRPMRRACAAGEASSSSRAERGDHAASNHAVFAPVRGWGAGWESPAHRPSVALSRVRLAVPPAGAPAGAPSTCLAPCLAPCLASGQTPDRGKKKGPCRLPFLRRACARRRRRSLSPVLPHTSPPLGLSLTHPLPSPWASPSPTPSP